MRIFAIRPEPGLSATIAAGAAQGLPITGFPLSGIEASGWTLPDLVGLDGLLVGSANAFRHGGDKLDALKHLPVLAVGESTAAAARAAGFEVAQAGAGGLQSLVDQLEPRFRRILRLCGEARVSLTVPDTVEIIERVVYRVQPIDIEGQFELGLARPSLVLLHSASSAEHFASEVDRLGILRENIALAALGPRILANVGSGWRAARAAPVPTDDALLAMARDMCQ